MERRYFYISFFFVLLLIIGGCSEPVEHTAPAVRDRDSLPMMVSYGVNTIISDSGVQKYRIVTERWEVNTVVSRPYWRFEKGLYFSQFDNKFKMVQMLTCDTAYYYNKDRLWKFRGRVTFRNNQTFCFKGNELYYDQNQHLYYSNEWFKITDQDFELEGDRFRCDDKFNSYHVWTANGWAEREFLVGSDSTSTSNSTVSGNDSLPPLLHDDSSPFRKGTSAVPDSTKTAGNATETEEKSIEEDNKVI